MFHKAGRVLQ